MYRTNCFKRHLTFLLLLAFLVGQLSFSNIAFAGWDDKSDELPGYSTGEFLGKVALVAGIAIVTVLILKAGNKKKDEKKKEDEKEKQSLQTGSLQERLYSGDSRLQDLQPPKLMPYLGAIPNAANGGSPGLAVGVAFNF